MFVFVGNRKLKHIYDYYMCNFIGLFKHTDVDTNVIRLNECF